MRARSGTRARKDAIVFVAGPTASGKTTLVKRLRTRATVYLEDVSLNPHLPQRPGVPFDVLASQHWFLQSIRSFISEQAGRVLVVDQHPLVISRVYGKMFCQARALSNTDLRELDSRAVHLWEAIGRQSKRVLTVCLTASTQVLMKRLKARGVSALNASAVRQVNELFGELVFSHECIAMNSEVLTPQRETRAVVTWLDRENAS